MQHMLSLPQCYLSINFSPNKKKYYQIPHLNIKKNKTKNYLLFVVNCFDPIEMCRD